jgi:chromosome segregation ATPase
MDTQQINLLAENLLTLPQIIQEIQIALLDTTEEILKVNKEISVLESKIKSEISAEVDENNKKVYPNSESRDAAFVEKSSHDSELTNLQSSYASLQRLSNIRRCEIERLQNDQRNIRSVLDFFRSI